MDSVCFKQIIWSFVGSFTPHGGRFVTPKSLDPQGAQASANRSSNANKSSFTNSGNGALDSSG